VASTALSAFGASVWVPWHDDWAAGGSVLLGAHTSLGLDWAGCRALRRSRSELEASRGDKCGISGVDGFARFVSHIDRVASCWLIAATVEGTEGGAL
jgi:hypothetical protein